MIVILKCIGSNPIIYHQITNDMEYIKNFYNIAFSHIVCDNNLFFVFFRIK